MTADPERDTALWAAPDRRPLLMGVLNITPDSFSDGGRFESPEEAVAAGMAMVAEGADILDIGGESTRPGARPAPEDEERARVLPAIEGLAAKTDAVLSIDTRKPAVARAAVAAGATIWNDVSALGFDPDSLATAAALGCGVVLMHARGTPETMQDDPRYEDPVEEVYAWLAARLDACVAAGVDRGRTIVDPGIGFGKTAAHNLALLRGVARFADLGRPVTVGASRKRFIAAVDRDGPASARVGGSVAAALAAARGLGAAGATAILRVHDVAATRQALAVARALEAEGG